MDSPSCAVITLGCRVNQYESDRLLRGLGRYGVKEHAGIGNPDVMVVNTCAVTKISDKKSRQLIRKAIRENPGSKIVVTGCYAELEAAAIRAIDGVAHVAGNGEKEDLPEMIAALLGVGLSHDKFMLSSSDVKVRSMLKVQDGCDAFCTYCAVPYARGVLKSRDVEEAAAEAKELVAAGAREIVLTGIHLGKYGQDSAGAAKAGARGPVNLSALVIAILRACPPSDLSRIRLSSLEISEVDRELEALLANEERLCRHLHLPLQSGSDSVLSSMGRKYRAQDYVETAQRLSAAIPDLAITSDVIVGFPGESHEDFAATISCIQDTDLCWVHVFPFSARDQAPASRYPNQIARGVKDERAQLLGTLSRRLRHNFHATFIGRGLKVLVEEWDCDAQIATGLTDNYLRVTFPAQADITGAVVSATPDSVSPKGVLSAPSCYVL